MENQNQMDLNEEEIKNLFYFLGSEETTNKENLKASSIIFGLENLGLHLSTDNIRHLKMEIEKKAKNGSISLDDFKSLWISNIDTKYQTKEMANYLYHLMVEIISESEESILVKFKEPDNNITLNEDKLYWLLEKLGIFEDTPVGPVDNKRKTTSSNINKQKSVAKEMIEALAINSKDVTVKDLEFLIKQYFNLK